MRRRGLVTLPCLFFAIVVGAWVLTTRRALPSSGRQNQQQQQPKPVATMLAYLDPTTTPYYTLNESIMTPYFLDHLWYMMNATKNKWTQGFWSAYDSIDISQCRYHTPECGLYLLFPDHSLPYRKCCVEHWRLMETTRYVTERLSAANVTYFLSTGTALGVYRHGGVMVPWDTDVDIAVKPQSASLLKDIFTSPPIEHYYEKDRLGKGMVWVHYSKDGEPSGGPHVEVFHEGVYTKHPEYLPLHRCQFYNISVWCPNVAMLDIWFKSGWDRYNSDHYHSDNKCLRYRLGEINMLLTLISRVSDGLALSADTSEPSSGATFPDLDKYKFQAKGLIRRLSPSSPSSKDFGEFRAMSISNGDVGFHILKDDGVFFLTMCESASSSSVAFSYLEDISKEFLSQHGSQVDAAQRPYCFIRFDMFLQKTKRVYTNPSQRAIATNQKYAVMKQTFNEVMGYVAEGGQNGKKENTMLVVALSIGTAVFVLMIVLWLTVWN